MTWDYQQIEDEVDLSSLSREKKVMIRTSLTIEETSIIIGNTAIPESEIKKSDFYLHFNRCNHFVSNQSETNEIIDEMPGFTDLAC
jgi:hypothetical protein